MMTKDNPPWQRRKGERSEGFELFTIYRDLGHKRSLDQVSETVRNCPNLNITVTDDKLQKLSSRWDWSDRAIDYDNYLDKQTTMQSIKKKKEANEDNFNLGVKFNDIICDLLHDIKYDGEVKIHQKAKAIKDLSNAFVNADKVQRLASNQSTENTNSEITNRTEKISIVLEKIKAEIER